MELNRGPDFTGGSNGVTRKSFGESSQKKHKGDQPLTRFREGGSPNNDSKGGAIYLLIVWKRRKRMSYIRETLANLDAVSIGNPQQFNKIFNRNDVKNGNLCHF